MAIINAHTGEIITLHGFTMKGDRTLENQPASFPKIEIDKMNSDNSITDILSETVMDKDTDGEYFYNWTAPQDYGNYKARYTAVVNNKSVFGFDEIYIRNTFPSTYEIHGINADRFDALINTNVLLQAQVYKNGIVFDPLQITRVEIYDSRQEAEKVYGIGIPVETINEPDITKHATITGRYGYNVSALSAARLFYDKVYMIPSENEVEKSFILPFYIRKDSLGASPPGEKEKCEVSLFVRDILDTIPEKCPIHIEMNPEIAWYGKELIKKESEHLDINEAGKVIDKDGNELSLIETETMSIDTGADVYYTIDIGGVWTKSFQIPKGTISADFRDLPEYAL